MQQYTVTQRSNFHGIRLILSHLKMDENEIISSLVLLASSSTDATLKRSLIIKSSPAVIQKIVEIVRGVVFGEIEIGSTERQQLKRSRAKLHALASKQKSELLKRQLLAQKSSIRVLTLLLAAALPRLDSPDETWKVEEKKD